MQGMRSPALQARHTRARAAGSGAIAFSQFCFLLKKKNSLLRTLFLSELVRIFTVLVFFLTDKVHVLHAPLIGACHLSLCFPPYKPLESLDLDVGIQHSPGLVVW